MGNTNAGKVGMDNSGQTDKERGTSNSFSYSKTQRKDGRIGGGPATSPNENSVDANKRTVADKRLS